MNHIDVRLANLNERRELAGVARAALLMPAIDDTLWDATHDTWETDYVAAGAWDGDRCVGHVGSLDFRMLLPGGEWVSTAGVTRVGVLPTHARQGLLTRMMRQVLEAERANGKVLAALLASETPIYGRFGFGHATDEHDLRVDVPRVGHVRGAAPGSFRLLSRDETVAVTTEIYDRVAHRPGTIRRLPWMQARYVEDVTKGEKAAHVVVHHAPDGTAHGYAHYVVDWHDERGVERLGHAEVKEIVAADAGVELALWSYLCNVSLIREIRFERAPTTSLIRLAANDARAVSVNGVWDELFIRPLDVHACLAARAYGDSTASVTIAVIDPLFENNNRTFAISAGGARPTDAAADITATVNALGATILGGRSWATQAAIGEAQGSPDALRAADSLFGQHPTPFCGSFF